MKTNPILLALIEVSLVLPLSLGAAQFCTNVPAGSYWVPGTVDLFSGYQPGTQLFRYFGGFSAYTFDDVDLVWTPSEPTHRPGEGFIIITPDMATFCFPEPSHSPVLPLTLYPGLNLVCCQSNAPATYEQIVGAPPAPGTRLLREKKGATNPFPIPPLGSTGYVMYTYLGGAWSPTTPIAGVGEAVFIYITPSIQNVGIVNGKMEFDVYSPAGYQMTIDRTDSLTSPQWQTLTTITPGGGMTHISDPDPISAHAQRYYRARL
jgi:hypothetical protein